ncbi:MAG: ClpXP protease specificity-enhancing factor [Proteobacteria bacterium]|nr:ClpXP protease specificity-enhancing factor [Pseudomonadota bacterium]
MISQKPYLIRAIYEWCMDSGLTPFLATMVDNKTNVPHQYVQNGQIILNLSANATKDVLIDCEWITFSATFGGVLQDVAIPINNVIAIFAQENGQGMQFNVEIKPESNSEHSGLKLVK